jgi:sortase A
MLRIVAWLMILAGGALFVVNALPWFKQNQLVIKDTEAARSIADNWEDRTPLPSLSKGIESHTKHKVGEKIGELIIPRMGEILPIVEGTDEKSLEKGVGRYRDDNLTVQIGETGHVVLAGHRDTVLRGVGELKIGDKLYIRYEGHIFTYQIRKTWITHADDRTVIVPIDRPVLSLTTCYPFDYVGSAPDRYIIRADLVEIKTDQRKNDS